MEHYDDKTVKVVLTTADMQELNLSYDKLDYQKPETQKALNQIIKKVNTELHINLGTAKLFIEAYPYADGGCILFINKITIARNDKGTKKYKFSFDTPILYSFKELNSLGALSKRLMTHHQHIITKSSLYHSKETKEYFLMLYTYFKRDDTLLIILSEYGKYMGRGVLAQALIKEHTDELIESKAIETLYGCI